MNLRLAMVALVGLGALSAGAQDLQSDFEELVQYDTGAPSEALVRIRDAVSLSIENPEERVQLESQFVRILNSKGVSMAAKQFASKELYRIASPDSLKDLQRLLRDNDTSDLVRYIVERMPGSAAQSALMTALNKAKGEARIGVINSLGERGNASAVRALKKLSGNGDPATMRAALVALGKIGGHEAANHLLWATRNIRRDTRPLAAEGYLRAADKFLAMGDPQVAGEMYKRFLHEDEADYIQMAAFKGVVTADPRGAGSVILNALRNDSAVLQVVALEALNNISNAGVHRELADEVDTLAPRFQVRVLETLARSGEMIGMDATLEATASEDPMVEAAAVAALVAYPSISTIDTLLTISAEAEGAVKDAARTSLAYIDLPQAEDRFINAAMNADNRVRIEAMYAISQRKSDKAIPVLLRTAKRDAEVLRIEALHALGELARLDTLDDIVDLLVKAPTPESMDAAQEALTVATIRLPSDPDRTKALRKGYKGSEKSSAADLAIVEILGELADDSGLSTLESATARTGSAVQGAAVKALGQWPTAKPMEILVKVALKTEDASLQGDAYGGAIRLAGRAKELSGEESLKLYQKLVPLATTKARKLQLLSAIGQTKEPMLAEIVTLYVNDAEVSEEAALAMDQINPPAKEA